jgi:uncharacterized membrane protein
MFILVILCTIPALIWAFQIPGSVGALLVFFILLAVFSGGGSAGPDILGRLGSVKPWSDVEAGSAWNELIRYINLLASRETVKWGNPFFLRASGWISALLSMYSLVFAGLLAYALVQHEKHAIPEMYWMLYAALALGVLVVILALLVRYQYWNHSRPLEDSQLVASPDQAAALIREYLTVCGGERIPGWFNLPFIRLLPAITTAAYHYGTGFADAWAGNPHSATSTAISWVVVALMGYYALVLFKQIFVQWDNLCPERVCPCRFVPMLKLVRYARLVRNGGSPWYDKCLYWMFASK